MMALADPIVLCEHHGPRHNGPHRLDITCVWPHEVTPDTEPPMPEGLGTYTT